MVRVKNDKKMVIELPECPVCLEAMWAPIFLCQTGHSLCQTCTEHLIPSFCPICHQAVTQMRNWQLEELITKAIVKCPHQASGCSYKTVTAKMENHIKECIFREMACPMSIFGRCSWLGVHKEMLNHFKDLHPQNILKNLNQAVTIDNISIIEDDRFVYIIIQRKKIFIFTLKIDINQKLAYWVVQLIGCQKVAQNHVYEINISSLQDTRRRVTYNDHCLSDAMDTNEIFRLAKCCVMPLNFLDHFINGRAVTFHLKLKRNQSAPLKEQNSDPKQCNPNPDKRYELKLRAKNPSDVTNAPPSPPLENNQNENNNNIVIIFF